MFLGLIILVAIIAVLLILIVLIQNSKGGGLTSEFAGSGNSQMFGVKKTTDLLEQITWGFAGAIVVISLLSYVVVSTGGANADGFKSVNIERAQSTAAPGGSIAPAAETAPAEQTPAAATDSVK